MQWFTAVTIVVRGENGFDWLAATVGAATTLGLAAIIGGLHPARSPLPRERRSGVLVARPRGLNPRRLAGRPR